jgi:hypothetical protein
MLLLILHAFAHETPRNRLAQSRVLLSGQCAASTAKLKVGQIAAVIFDDKNGVLGLMNPQDFSVYFGLTPLNSSRTSWFSGPGPGFYHFGQNRALVEIVALKSTDVQFTGCYVGPSACTSIFSASSLSYELTIKKGKRSCFLATDLNPRAQIQGILNSTTVEIQGTAQISEPSVFSDSFRIINVLESNSSTLTFAASFTGGKPQFDYPPVTPDSETALIGISGNLSFPPLIGEPDYPAMRLEIPLSTVIVACFFGICAAFALIVMMMLYVFRFKLGGIQSRDASLTLYDVQKQGEVAPEEPVREPQTREAVDEPGELPSSPYEGDEPGYL